MTKKPASKQWTDDLGTEDFYKTRSILKLNYFICFFCSTVEELNHNEFLMEVQCVWGKGPIWYGAGKTPRPKEMENKHFGAG